MSNSFVFSKILPLNSIVNPNTSPTDYLDSQNPFSFFDYIKYINSGLTPIQINDSYLEYLKLWGDTKKLSQIQIDQNIQQRYIEFIKEIVLKYSTLEEKRFFSNIDYDDETDIDIILPFLSKKIREICDFYSKKREKLKNKTQKIKNKGTPNSLEQSIFETITDVVFSDVLEVGTYQKLIDENVLLKDLNIEIEELYDLYTNYLDNDPTLSYETYEVSSELRKTHYSANINTIDANIFINFDKAIVDQLLQDVRIFLVEFGRIFTINYNLDSVDLNCKPDEKLYKFITDNKAKSERLVTLKSKLIKKYIGCDYHYIITGSSITNITSDILFKADNPSGNLLNRHFPTTASIEEETDLQSCRRIGLFFTPEKNSILYFSVPDKKYTIDYTKLEPNKLYIFPDPNLYGNTSGLTRNYQEIYPLIHICDYTKNIKNKSHGAVEGDINTNPYTQDFYAYFSRNQLSDTFSYGNDGLNTNFSKIYNNGIVCKWATDIFGNQYALFKDKVRNKLIDNTITVTQTENICEYYDGGPITFYKNGFLVEDTLISNPRWVYPNIWASDYYYNILIEGGVGGINNGITERGLYFEGYLIDGLDIDRTKIVSQTFDIIFNDSVENVLSKIDGELYTNNPPIMYNWIINDNKTKFLDLYDTTIEGLYYDRNYSSITSKPEKTLDGNNQGNVLEVMPNLGYNYGLSSIKYKEFDGGDISDECSEIFDFNEQTHFVINETLTSTKTILANYSEEYNKNPFELRNSFGMIYVKNVLNNEVLSLYTALSVQLQNKYNETYEEILDFNIYNDFIWIKTKNKLIFEKIDFDSTGFIYSGTSTNYINSGYNNSYLSNVSDPFIFENREYAMVVNLSASNIKSNNFYIIPSIYKINYKTCVKTLITNNLDISNYLNNSILNSIKITKINQPVLTYNTRNAKYCITTTIEDQNEFAYIYQMKFEYDGNEILNQNIKLYNMSGDEVFKTINFYDKPSLSNNSIIINNANLNTSIVFNDDSVTFF